MGNTIPTTVRIPEELKSNLEEIAKRENRSLNNLITDRYDTYWNLNMTEAIKFYRGDTGNKVGEASCRVLFSFSILNLPF